MPILPMIRYASMWRLALCLVLVGGCDGCVKRNRDVCCTTEAECDELGLPPGSVGNYGCREFEACVDLTCTPKDELPDAAPAVDASTARCNPNGDFGTPERVPAINSGDIETSFAMMPDELTAFVGRDDSTRYWIGVTRRTSKLDDFPPVMDTDPVSASIFVGAQQQFSRQGRLLYFSDRLGRFFAASRPNLESPFFEGSQLRIDGTLLTTIRNARANADGLTLYWIDTNDSFMKSAPNQGPEHAFGAPSQMSTMQMDHFVLSDDELTVFYGPAGTDDVYVSTRLSTNVAFTPGSLVPGLSGQPTSATFLTQDQCLLYVLREAGTASDVYVARRAP